MKSLASCFFSMSPDTLNSTFASTVSSGSIRTNSGCAASGNEKSSSALLTITVKSFTSTFPSAPGT